MNDLTREEASGEESDDEECLVPKAKISSLDRKLSKRGACSCQILCQKV